MEISIVEFLFIYSAILTVYLRTRLEYCSTMYIKNPSCYLFFLYKLAKISIEYRKISTHHWQNIPPKKFAKNHKGMRRFSLIFFSEDIMYIYFFHLYQKFQIRFVHVAIKLRVKKLKNTRQVLSASRRRRFSMILPGALKKL